MRRKNTLNPKRRLHADPERSWLTDLGNRARYAGNPEHKRNPGDFGLTPPASPRRGKSLCDGVRIFERREALRLLREGFSRGLVSEQLRNGWPQNVWAVLPDGTPLEAQLENEEFGAYHGYPMPSSDVLAPFVVERWHQRTT